MSTISNAGQATADEEELYMTLKTDAEKEAKEAKKFKAVAKREQEAMEEEQKERRDERFQISMPPPSCG